jgi:tyrosinase
MAGTRVRQDVWKLTQTDKWHPTLLWYAKAIAKMQTRPISDFNSWRYQAAIHDYIVGQDPDVTQDNLPADASTFWAQCQHVSWFFLPWHRMYLFHFEQIIADTIAKLGGDPGWSLPYWNYSDPTNPDARKLPPAFTEITLPDGSPNALRVNTRQRGNDGRIVAAPQSADINQCLGEPDYAADRQGGDPGFGGPQTAFNHGEGDIVGALETTPHGSMHVAVGGWMGSFETAGLDPIFWLHHSNIDRLWNVWRKAGHQNPASSSWLTNVSFPFHDFMGNVVTHVAKDVVESTADPLSYQYEDETDPTGAADSTPRILSVGEKPIPEMVGATNKPVTLAGKPVSASFAVKQPTGPARTLAVGDAPRRMYLNVENITGPHHHTSYSVYLNLPAGDDASKHPELLAGNMALFGVAQASRSTDKHAGSGLHYAFEVSKVVRKLEAKGDWDPKNIRVSFIPDYPDVDVERTLSIEPKKALQVGRISLYHK